MLGGRRCDVERYGVRPHYGVPLAVAILGTVAGRQVLLHVLPGDPGFGTPLLGYHLYTWSFLAFVCIGLILSVMLWSPAVRAGRRHARTSAAAPAGHRASGVRASPWRMSRRRCCSAAQRVPGRSGGLLVVELTELRSGLAALAILSSLRVCPQSTCVLPRICVRSEPNGTAPPPAVQFAAPNIHLAEKIRWIPSKLFWLGTRTSRGGIYSLGVASLAMPVLCSPAPPPPERRPADRCCRMPRRRPAVCSYLTPDELFTTSRGKPCRTSARRDEPKSA